MENMNYKRTFWSVYKQDQQNVDDAIMELKNTGASQMECVRTLVMELKMSLPEADNAVVNSPAWMPFREDVIRFRREFNDLLDTQE
jgi:hypothetical protein